MLYNGEHIGDGSPPEVDIAVDPLEGTTLDRASGCPTRSPCIALSERGTMFDPGPCVYMEKLAGGARHRRPARPRPAAVGDACRLVAERKGVDVRDVMVVMLDRPRHEEAHRRRSARPARASGSSPTATSPRRCWRSSRQRSPSTCCGASAARLRACIARGRDQVHGRRAARPPVAARRRRAPGRDRRRLRPRRRSSRQDDLVRGDNVLLLGDRRHRRRRAAGRALPGRARARRPSRSSCARARARCAASRRATTAPSCARSPARATANGDRAIPRLARADAAACLRGSSSSGLPCQPAKAAPCVLAQLTCRGPAHARPRNRSSRPSRAGARKRPTRDSARSSRASERRKPCVTITWIRDCVAL